MAISAYTRDSLWKSEDGRKIRIRDLPIDHLINIGNWVQLPQRDRTYSDGVKKIITAELEIRAFECFADNKPFPRLVDSEWILIKNQ